MEGNRGQIVTPCPPPQGLVQVAPCKSSRRSRTPRRRSPRGARRSPRPAPRSGLRAGRRPEPVPAFRAPAAMLREHVNFGVTDYFYLRWQNTLVCFTWQGWGPLTAGALSPAASCVRPPAPPGRASLRLPGAPRLQHRVCGAPRLQHRGCEFARLACGAPGRQARRPFGSLTGSSRRGSEVLGVLETPARPAQFPGRPPGGDAAKAGHGPGRPPRSSDAGWGTLPPPWTPLSRRETALRPLAAGRV